MKYVVLVFALMFGTLAYANSTDVSNIKFWGKTNTEKVVFFGMKQTWKVPVSHCPAVVNALEANNLKSVVIRSDSLAEGVDMVFNGNMTCRIQEVEVS